MPDKMFLKLPHDAQTQIIFGSFPSKWALVSFPPFRYQWLTGAEDVLPFDFSY